MGGSGHERVTLAHDGTEIPYDVFQPGISGDGSQIVFVTDADGVVAGDADGGTDVFVRNLGPTFPRIRCQGKLNSAGCVPFVDFQGVPSVSDTEPFLVRSRGVVANEVGFLIYGTAGRLNLNFHGGKLCVKLPFQRMPPSPRSGSRSAAACTACASTSTSASKATSTRPCPSGKSSTPSGSSATRPTRPRLRRQSLGRPRVHDRH